MARTKIPVKSLTKGESASFQTSSQRPAPPQIIPEKETTPSRPRRKTMATRKKQAMEDTKKRQRKVESDSETDSSDSLDRVVALATSSGRKKLKASRTPTPPSIPRQTTEPIPPTPQLPLLKGNLDEGVDQAKFKLFKERKIGGIVSVNFEALKIEPDLKLDLSKTLGHFSKWLTVNESFSLDIVRRFYCNMSIHDLTNDEGEVLKSYAISKLRGREVRIDDQVINEVLGTDKMSFEKMNMTHARSYKILLQADKYPGHLTFKVNEMCDYYKIIHYIYSRSMCNKSSSYQYLNKQDYLTLASIIDQQKLNFGSMIYNEMRTFCLEKTNSSTLPFPQIVSLILIKNRIHHLEGKPLTLPIFGKSLINKMHIPLPLDLRKAMLPKREKEKGKAKVTAGTSSQIPEDTEHSSASIPSHSIPASETPFAFRDKFNLLMIKQNALTERQTDILSYVCELRNENSLLREEVNELKSINISLRQEVADVRNLLLAYLHNLGPGIPVDDLQEQGTKAPSPVHISSESPLEPSPPPPAAFPQAPLDSSVKTFPCRTPTLD